MIIIYLSIWAEIASREARGPIFWRQSTELKNLLNFSSICFTKWLQVKNYRYRQHFGCPSTFEDREPISANQSKELRKLKTFVLHFFNKNFYQLQVIDIKIKLTLQASLETRGPIFGNQIIELNNRTPFVFYVLTKSYRYWQNFISTGESWESWA